MRATVQRVSQAQVVVDGNLVGAIEQGLLVYIGVAPDDGPDDVAYIADKVTGLRIFNDDAGKMNRSVLDIAGGVLAISAFALQADARKGRRPSFDGAAPPDLAQKLYDETCAAITARGVRVERGIFRAHMLVSSVNDGPICVLLDSKRLF
jgi:D-tyrosyl-tRNA(Tyr) deacylase